MIKRIIITEIIAIIISFVLTYCFVSYARDTWNFHNWDGDYTTGFKLFTIWFLYNCAFISMFLQFVQSYLYEQKEYNEFVKLTRKLK
jgi:uncharacterized membrane protein (DUF485 family)